MNKIFIYALKCPIFNAIRYIGQSTNPVERYSNHKNSGNLYIKKWFVKLKELNLKPELIILEEVSGIDANDKEDYYIDKYQNEDYIFNKVRNRSIKFKENKEKIRQKRKELSKELVDYKRDVVAFKNLTKTETIIVQHLVKNTSYKEICEKLFISYSTLKTHTKHIRVKLNLVKHENTKDWIFDLMKIYNEIGQSDDA